MIAVTRWDKVYQNKTHVYGQHGNGLVWQHLQDAPPGPVLDIGCGEGRNGLMAARSGRKVDGLDLSQVAVERANAWAAAEGLSFHAQTGDVLRHIYPGGTYAAVVAAFTLPFVRKSEVPGLLRRWAEASVPGGLLYMSALLTTDPDAAAHVGRYEEIEPGTFWKPELGECRTFFAPGEMRELLDGAGYEVVEYLEGTFYEVSAAEGPHHHHQVQAVGRKTGV